MYTYIAMERTQIYLTSDEASALDRIASERGVTRSHLIREAIDAAYVSPRESQRDRLLATLAEIGPPWSDRTDLPDGETYVERIRAGQPVTVEAPHGSAPRSRR
jgi:predicted transcriptional regulator